MSIPVHLLIVFLAVVLAVLFKICCKKSSISFVFFLPIFLISVICILLRTVFLRSVIIDEVVLQPLITFILAKQQPELYRSFFMNALLFVPLGLSMPYCLSKKPYKRNVFITIGFAAAFSAGIEFLQYYYHLGRCETDDVIANTLGASVGTLSYCLYIRILKNQEKGKFMHNNIDTNQKLLLDLCAKSLFDKDVTIPDELDNKALIEESKTQTVFSITYSLIKDKCEVADDKTFSQILAKNIRVEYAHNEVHRVLSSNNISYVILKGVASAAYYKEPILRMMGDIDILVSPDDITKADKLLNSIGFFTADDINSDNTHIGYKRKDGVICELHRNINGIPKNEVGDIIKKYFSDIFEKSTEYNTSNGICIIPDKFHHGLILLLHTASHLTSEGVGLRHLCDWAVFVNSFSDDDFVDIFEKPLKDTGLWRFAQLLTLCCVKYLGCNYQKWIGHADEILLETMISDILNGGNFGTKDFKRYNHIKYISDRKEGTISRTNPIFQLFSSINTKTKKEFSFVNKTKILLPFGWLLTICKYFYLVITGKRVIDGMNTVLTANARKKIYNEFKLFKK